MFRECCYSLAVRSRKLAVERKAKGTAKNKCMQKKISHFSLVTTSDCGIVLRRNKIGIFGQFCPAVE